jgi:hypothetical protein
LERVLAGNAGGADQATPGGALFQAAAVLGQRRDVHQQRAAPSPDSEGSLTDVGSIFDENSQRQML